MPQPVEQSRVFQIGFDGRVVPWERHQAERQRSRSEDTRPMNQMERTPQKQKRKRGIKSSPKMVIPPSPQINQEEDTDWDVNVNMDETPLPQVKPGRPNCDLNMEVVEVNIVEVRGGGETEEDTREDTREENTHNLNRRLRPRVPAPRSPPSTTYQASETYACHHCGKGFDKLNNLRVHMLVHSSPRRSPTPDAESGPYTTYSTPDPDETSPYTTYSTPDPTEPSPYTCPQCGKGFIKLNGLRLHMRVHSSSPKPSPPKAKRSPRPTHRPTPRPSLTQDPEPSPYKCHQCGKGFGTLNSLRVHYMHYHSFSGPSNKTKPMPEPAPEYTSSKRKRKNKTKSKQKPGRPAKPTPPPINRDDMPFACEVCGKGFHKMNNVRVHMLVHSGERRYRCQHCPKRFITSNHLKRHQTVHTKAKPYTCPGCGSGFTQLCSLRRHRTQTLCGEEDD